MAPVGKAGRGWAAVLVPLMFCALFLWGCAGKTAATGTPKDQTLHLKQVLERYDAAQQPVEQYMELWVAPPVALSHELDADGHVISVALDNADGHIQYDAKTKEARKSDAVAVFHINFQSFKAAFARATVMGELQYAGRKCIAWQLESDDEDNWVKVYVDQQTGWVLFCDAPLFRLRTAKVELLTKNDKLFATPTDLKFK